ncbi:MAG: DUF4124 domain-containing protein [Gammaproteobacteria bacterium]|nr:DUF4124 domain-containing protein [Gammaproteobacteria bacterium]
MARGDENLKPFDFGSGHPASAQSAGAGFPRWLAVALVLVLGLGGGAAYLYYVDRDLGRELLEKTPLKPPVSVTTAYKWKDADGNLQITDRPPADGTPYETMKIRSDANVVPALESAEKSRN